MPDEQRTEIRTSGRSTVVHHQLVDRHRPRLQLDLLAGPHPGIGTLAVHLDGGDGGRHLLDVADEPRQLRAYVVLAHAADVVGRDDLALGVVGGRDGPEPDGRVVGLLGEHQVAEQPGGPVDAEHEHAGGHRVEGAGVADLAGAGQPAHPGDDVVRRHARGLVDDDETGVDHQGRSSSSGSSSGSSGRTRRRATSASSSRRRPRSRGASCRGRPRRRRPPRGARRPPRPASWPARAPRRGRGRSRGGRRG